MVRRPFLDLYRAWLHHLPRSFHVVVVVASAVYMLNKLNLPLELPATALLANVAQIYDPGLPVAADARRHLAVVEIDDQHFKNEFQGTSPLNRCKLKEQIERLLLNPDIRVLAIDLDLSPADPAGYQQARADLEAGRRVDELQRCQYEFEEFLREASQWVSIITISPLDDTEGRERGRQWNNAVHFPHVKFGSPELELRFGMVHDYRFPPEGYTGDKPVPFAEIVVRELCTESMAARGSQGRSREWLPPPKGCDQVLSASTSRQQVQANAEFKTYPISYFETRYLHERGLALDPDDPCLEWPRKTARGDCDIRIVLLGGSYGVGDRYLTPVGARSGVQIHAAIAAQIHKHTWHGWGILADIGIGIVFGFLVHMLWGMYFVQRAATGSPRNWWWHPQMSYVWLLALAIVFSLLLAGTVYFCTWVYARWGTWISPVPMALAMLFESAISGSVHAATHKIQREAEHARSAISTLERTVSELQATLFGAPATEASAQAAVPAVSGPAPWPAHVPRVLALLMVAYVAFDLIRESPLFH